jgi:hypothetical protein
MTMWSNYKVNKYPGNCFKIIENILDYIYGENYMELAVTVFVGFLYYSFIHLCVEKAFGKIPAILISSLLYVALHVGTQLSLGLRYIFINGNCRGTALVEFAGNYKYPASAYISCIFS